MNLNHFIRNLLVIIISASIISSCSGEKLDSVQNQKQKEYEQDFKLVMCTVMEGDIKRYKEDPFRNNFGMQGYATKERVMEHLNGMTLLLLRKVYWYGHPNKYQPDPAIVSYDEVRKNCPEIAVKFWQIPF
jgi:hypothetical protein